MDKRMVQAAAQAASEGFAEISLLATPNQVQDALGKDTAGLGGVRVIDHLNSTLLKEFAGEFFEMRKAKGLTQEEALKAVSDNVFFGDFMVRKGYADGCVSGAFNTTALVMRAAIQVLGCAKGIKSVSSCFIMVHPDKKFGQDGLMIFADCAVIPYPDENQLADIAIASAASAKAFCGMEPRIAMLSFSTKGSAKHENLDKVLKAVDIVRQKRPDLSHRRRAPAGRRARPVRRRPEGPRERRRGEGQRPDLPGPERRATSRTRPSKGWAAPRQSAPSCRASPSPPTTSRGDAR